MKYLPFEQITYQTLLEPEEILRRLDEIVEPKRTISQAGFFGARHEKPYEGRIHGKSFDITRIIHYRNSFLPQISGTIESELSGSAIPVTMKLHPIALVFMIVWMGGVGLACVVFLVNYIQTGAFELAMLIPFGMLIFGYALVTGGFKYESVKSRKYFAELFEAKMEV